MGRNHRQLTVFQKADELAVLVYRLTAKFPSDERFELRSQLRRAAVSTPTNIVEGCARDSRRDYARFLDIA
ncbi:MAG: four helix bundle protein [Acidobacteria bacterium]|nr:four helix bundle protein [Acidobacteriota bacterium]